MPTAHRRFTEWSKAGLWRRLHHAVLDAAHVLAAFGPDRVMFGSDWPVCELAATYGQVYEAAQPFTSSLSISDREEVFAGTATRAYPISVASS